MGAASPSSANPYPIRTMIGNMVWRIRQHKTPLMVIPPVLRLLYQFRGPIMTGFNSAFKGIGGGVGGPAGARRSRAPRTSPRPRATWPARRLEEAWEGRERGRLLLEQRERRSCSPDRPLLAAVFPASLVPL
ncbi:hypothetical protein TYRP_010310 [Tyrophagus putrescentiae]|nr:hypothetical protein TYRP_010310 [Tyrophagus putrescentiae]